MSDDLDPTLPESPPVVDPADPDAVEEDDDAEDEDDAEDDDTAD